MQVHGSCHCGNISFELTLGADTTHIQARACSCSFCSKHGGVWTSDPGGALKVQVLAPEQVARYSFGTRTADFHVCTRCGVVPLVTSLIDGRLYCVVSVNAFDGIDPALIRCSPVSFDAESQELRLARRKRNWIADVDYPAALA